MELPKHQLSMTQRQRHVNSCFFTMVAVDDDRKPVAVPQLQPASPDEKRRWAAALIGRELRAEMRERFASVSKAA